MMNTLRHALILVLCAGAVGCGDDAPTAPSNSNVVGTWAGLATTPGEQTHLRLTLSPGAGDSVSGTWVWAVGGETIGGNLGGTVTGNSVTLSLRVNPIEQCRFDLTASVNGSRMTGSYAAVLCPGTGGGAVDLNKQ